MLMNDRWIQQKAEAGMIQPYCTELVRLTDENWKVISYGQSSYGYDIRLSPHDFRIFQRIPGSIIDPKNFDRNTLAQAELHDADNGKYFILPANSYGLGVAVERLSMPDNAAALAIGKSTYARVGVIANLTPAEPGWRGHLTLELSNSSSSDVRIYANEGICQLIFFTGEPPQTTYHDRQGKYQDQGHEVVPARV